MGSAASTHKYAMQSASRQELFAILQEEMPPMLGSEPKEAKTSDMKAECSEAPFSRADTEKSLEPRDGVGEKVKETVSEDVPQEYHLHFTLQDKPAILENTGAISYHGNVKEGAAACYVSFPGKYAAGWDALIKQEHDHSVACVFLCNPEDGLGQHFRKEPGGPCYCAQIYGERDFNTFGYLQVLPATCTVEEEQCRKDRAQVTGTVLVHENASQEEWTRAEDEAKRNWEARGRAASWGCAWFEAWKQQVEKAVAMQQTLKVVFFPGQVGKGIELFQDLPFADLWNGVGCGGSQKCEIAYLELMREKEGKAWDYDCVDVSHFMQAEFKTGSQVDAFDGKKWRRGRILRIPSAIVLNWTVQCDDGSSVVTDRIRHADAIQKLLKEVGLTEFLKMLQEALPCDLGKEGETLLPDSTPSFAVRVHSEKVETLQAVRDLVLSSSLEFKINSFLARKHATFHLRVNKTLFSEVYEKDILRLSTLTPHQREKLADVDLALGSSNVHLSAPAGAGKTFVAVQCALQKLQRTAQGQILFIAPHPSLGLYFWRWLQRSGQISCDTLLTRVVFMHQPYECLLALRVEGQRLIHEQLTDTNMQFLLVIVDEAHDIFRGDVSHGFLQDKVDSKQLLLLSSQSRSSAVDLAFPDAYEVQLTEVVRSTKRIVAGAAAFLGSSSEKQDLSSLCPAGPPLKTFLFESSGDHVKAYVQQTSAAMCYIMKAYAGLNLNNRVALLVSEPDFLHKFKPALEEHFKSHFTSRGFRLVSCEESLSLLPGDSEYSGEAVILDLVDHAKGLEQLLVLCIGLDKEVGVGKSDLVTRAQIYQALTRAQLQAVIVNHWVSGGWLEFLGLLRFKEEEFVESHALAETTTEAAEELMLCALPQEDVDVPVANAGCVSEEGVTPLTPFNLPGVVPDEAETGGVDEAAGGMTDVPDALDVPDVPTEELVWDSSVWDTEGNTLEVPIRDLRFDPRCQLDADDAGDGLVVETLQALRAAQKERITKIKIEGTGIFQEGAEVIAKALQGTRVKVLVLRDSQIHAVQVLAHALHGNRSVVALDLQSTQLRGGVQAIAAALKVNRSLRQIYLQNNGISAQGAEALAEALEVNRHIRELYLGVNNLGAAGAKAIARAFKSNRSLKIVSLDANDMGYTGAQAIAEALKVNSSIMRLSAWNNNFGPEGAEAIAMGLMVNRSLKVINLEGNNMGVLGAKAIAMALRDNKSLLEIELFHNNLAEGVEAIAEGLKTNRHATKIGLRDNKIGVEGAEALAELLKVNQTITILDLQVNFVGLEGAEAIAQALKVNHSIKELYLNGNEIGDIAMQVMASALMTNRTVTLLNLRDTGLGDVGAKALAEALKVNSTVARLDLQRNWIGVYGAKAIAQALRVNQSIREISLNGNYLSAEGLEALREVMVEKKAQGKQLEIKMDKV